jgi:hypothetical protein
MALTDICIVFFVLFKVQAGREGGLIFAHVSAYHPMPANTRMRAVLTHWLRTWFCVRRSHFFCYSSVLQASRSNIDFSASSG